jgi:hypothetical protein
MWNVHAFSRHNGRERYPSTSGFFRPLSTFGRTAAASEYAVSKVLYHLEFQGLPARAEVDRLLGSVSAVVDRAMTPAHQAAAPNARLPSPRLWLLAALASSRPPPPPRPCPAGRCGRAVCAGGC